MNDSIENAKEVFVGRLFTLGGSILFLIGSLLAADSGYKELVRITMDAEKK